MISIFSKQKTIFDALVTLVSSNSSFASYYIQSQSAEELREELLPALNILSLASIPDEQGSQDSLGRHDRIFDFTVNIYIPKNNTLSLEQIADKLYDIVKTYQLANKNLFSKAGNPTYKRSFETSGTTQVASLIIPIYFRA